jgi:hypothetical protein
MECLSDLTAYSTKMRTKGRYLIKRATGRANPERQVSASIDSRLNNLTDRNQRSTMSAALCGPGRCSLSEHPRIAPRLRRRRRAVSARVEPTAGRR